MKKKKKKKKKKEEEEEEEEEEEGGGGGGGGEEEKKKKEEEKARTCWFHRLCRRKSCVLFLCVFFYVTPHMLANTSAVWQHAAHTNRSTTISQLLNKSYTKKAYPSNGKYQSFPEKGQKKTPLTGKKKEKKKRTRQKEQQVYRYRKGISQGKKVYVAPREGVGVTVPQVISDQETDVISPIKQSTASALWMQWSPSAQWIQ